jgi:hypothetical protein
MEGPAPSLIGALLAAHIDWHRNLIQQDRRIKEFHPNQFAECDHVAPILANFPSKTCPDTPCPSVTQAHGERSQG